MRRLRTSLGEVNLPDPVEIPVHNWGGTVKFTKAVSLNSDYDQTSGLTSLAGNTFMVTGSFQQSGGSTTLEAGTIATPNLQLTGSGLLSGSGKVQGALTNNGTVDLDPGVLGTVTVTGAYTQTGGSLNVELGGTGSDQLVVQGSVQLGGNLNVQFLPNIQLALSTTRGPAQSRAPSPGIRKAATRW